MMTALAQVITAEKTASGYRVELSCDQQTSCSHCQSKQSCGTGIVSKAVGNKRHVWQITTSTAVYPGQLVEIGLPEKKLFQYAALVYLLPLFMLIIGAGVGQLLFIPVLGGGEGVTILASVGFMSLGLWGAQRISHQLQDTSKQSVTLVRVLGESIQVGN
jgi:sigma-E factor negative regulatory protein RseC